MEADSRIQLRYPLRDGLPPREAQKRPVVAPELETDARPREGLPLDDIDDIRELGLGLSHKLMPCRGIVEKIPDLDSSARRRSRFFHAPDDAAFDGDYSAYHLVAGPRNHPEPGYARYAGDRFPPEAEGAYGEEVLQLPYLARRMAFEGHERIVPRHPLAVIGNPYEPLPPRLELYIYLYASCVNRVFYQLFYTRGRPFPYPPRRYFGDKIIG